MSNDSFDIGDTEWDAVVLFLSALARTVGRLDSSGAMTSDDFLEALRVHANESLARRKNPELFEMVEALFLNLGSGVVVVRGDGELDRLIGSDDENLE